MIPRWLLITLYCIVSGCELGAGDHALVVVTVASDQPTDPADGIEAEISSHCGNDKNICLLQVGVIGGVVQRVGDTARVSTFCQSRLPRTPVPMLVFIAADKIEAIVQARLLDGSDEARCEGLILSETQKAVPANAVIRAVDAGVADAT